MVVYKQYNQQQLDNTTTGLHVHDFADYLEAWDKRSVNNEAKLLLYKRSEIW